MKNILVVFLITLFSFVTLALERVEHECVPIAPNSDLSKMRIVYSEMEAYRKEFLELYGQQGLLEKRWVVQYSDDMTYIAYSNEIENIFFERDWPVEKGQGPGTLQFGSFTEPGNRLKIYKLDCFAPARTRSEIKC